MLQSPTTTITLLATPTRAWPAITVTVTVTPTQPSHSGRRTSSPGRTPSPGVRWAWSLPSRSTSPRAPERDGGRSTAPEVTACQVPGLEEAHDASVGVDVDVLSGRVGR